MPDLQIKTSERNPAAADAVASRTETNLVTVVNIQSVSYTGTTWINLLLGCHQRAFALGPPARILELLEQGKEQAGSACRVHQDECTFWPSFFDKYDTARNFFVQLAEATNKDVIVINNPALDGAAAKQLIHPDIQVRELRIVRDGRSVVASYLRHHPEAGFIQAANDWFCPFASQFHFDPTDPDTLSMHYESVAEDPARFRAAAGEFIGLTYPENFHRFWEFDHHATAGNAGPIGVVRRRQGYKYRGREAKEREQKYQRIISEPDRPPVEQRWTAWTDRERAQFDLLAGHINEAWGYPRDRFPLRLIEEIHAELATQPSRKTQPLRYALRISTMRREGLHLAPKQVELAAAVIATLGLLGLVVVGVLIAAIF